MEKTLTFKVVGICRVYINMNFITFSVQRSIDLKKNRNPVLVKGSVKHNNYYVTLASLTESS